MKLSVLVVNINNLQYTRNCIFDLESQDYQDFELIVVDQGSTENGTEEYLNFLELKGVKIIRNGFNKPLNWIWNEFYRNSNSDYLCCLNNDVKLSPNFVSDTIKILDKESEVGIVIHTTNSSKYNKILNTLEYVYLDWRIKQGWDFTIRKSAYVEIPEILKFYWGDDWIFHNAYERGFNVAICLSSPIVHYGEKSSGYSPVNFIQEQDNFHSLGLKRYLPHYNPYNEVLPTFLEFGDEPFPVLFYNGEEDLVEFSQNLCSSEVEVINKIIFDETGGQMDKISLYLLGLIKIRCSIEINSALNKKLKFLIFKMDKFSNLWQVHTPGYITLENINQIKDMLII